MASLREVQLAFADAVLFDKTARIATLIAGDGIPPAERVGIYRNNCRIGFTATLAAEFPVVRQLGGEEWFEQTARRYQQQHPSASGNLHHVGALFAAYLAEVLQGSEFAYFADVAQLEWAYQEVLVAADHANLDLNLLSDVAADDYGLLQFHLHPASRIVASNYPILKMWQAHQGDAQATDMTSLNLDETQRVLIVRRDTHVELRALSLGEYLLLDAFARGEHLESALATVAQDNGAVPGSIAETADDGFDIAAVLPRLVQFGVLAGITASRHNHYS